MTYFCIVRTGWVRGDGDHREGGICGVGHSGGDGHSGGNGHSGGVGHSGGDGCGAGAKTAEEKIRKIV